MSRGTPEWPIGIVVKSRPPTFSLLRTCNANDRHVAGPTALMAAVTQTKSSESG